MKVNHKLELLDQFDDAAFALMMDEYAEAEGERLRMEFEEATRAGLTPARPDSLDEKCRKQIRREFGKQRRREYAACGKAMALRAAACILVALCISATLIMSVDAVRIPFLNYIIHHDSYSVLNPQPTSDTDDPIGDPIVNLLPKEYETVYFECSDGWLYNCGYQTDDGSVFFFDTMPGSAVYNFDTEDAESYLVTIRNHDVIFVKKDGFHAIWKDDNETTIFSVISNNMSEEELTSIIYDIIGIFP